MPDENDRGARLFHVSEEPNLEVFRPRPSPQSSPELSRPVVWAVDERRLPNYLLPRDCPRVCFAPATTTTAEDRQRFFGDSAAERIIAVEAGWRARITATQLYVYEFPPALFVLHDAEAGYWLSDLTVTAISKTQIADILAEHAKRGVELQFVTSLWPLRDAVMASSLCFSIIRMRNAEPRPDA